MNFGGTTRVTRTYQESSAPDPSGFGKRIRVHQLCASRECATFTRCELETPVIAQWQLMCRVDSCGFGSGGTMNISGC